MRKKLERIHTKRSGGVKAERKNHDQGEKLNSHPNPLRQGNGGNKGPRLRSGEIIRCEAISEGFFPATKKDYGWGGGGGQKLTKGTSQVDQLNEVEKRRVLQGEMNKPDEKKGMIGRGE